MHLTVDSLIEINNIITNSNNITLGKVNVKPHGFDRKLHLKFTERKIASTKFYSIVLNKIYPFYDGDGKRVRYCLLILI